MLWSTAAIHNRAVQQHEQLVCGAKVGGERHDCDRSNYVPEEHQLPHPNHNQSAAQETTAPERKHSLPASKKECVPLDILVPPPKLVRIN